MLPRITSARRCLCALALLAGCDLDIDYPDDALPNDRAASGDTGTSTDTDTDTDCEEVVWFVDADGDSAGDAETATAACEAPGDDWVAEGTDCDDTDPDVCPGADEISDGIDNDCDGDIDEGFGEEPDAVEIDITWSADGVSVSITGGAASSYDFGIAETGVGAEGWYGESCIPGEEPRGYDDYGYDYCHPLGASGGFVESVYPRFGEVADGATLFEGAFAADLTYYVGSAEGCWVTGDDPGYYRDFGCQVF